MQDEREYTPKTICGIEIVDGITSGEWTCGDLQHGSVRLYAKSGVTITVLGDLYVPFQQRPEHEEEVKATARAIVQVPRMQKTLVGLWEEYMALHEAIDRLKEERADLVEALDSEISNLCETAEKLQAADHDSPAEALWSIAERLESALAQARPERVEESQQ